MLGIGFGAASAGPGGTELGEDLGGRPSGPRHRSEDGTPARPRVPVELPETCDVLGPERFQVEVGISFKP